MAVWALGLNHTTAPLDLRGRFAFALDQLPPTLKQLRGNLASHTARQPEAAILSTCNRTEIYCAADQLALEGTLNWLAQTGGVAAQDLKAHTYTLEEGVKYRFGKVTVEYKTQGKDGKLVAGTPVVWDVRTVDAN